MRALLSAAMLQVGILTATAAPADTVAVSKPHGYRLTVAGLRRPEPLNHMHGLDLVLTGADGRLVAGAAISLTGERRYSDTPLPTMPRVASEPSPGHYRLDGLRFHMPGEWRLVFTVDLKQTRETIMLDVLVR